MKFLTAIILVLAFVTTVVSDGAMAQPFTMAPHHEVVVAQMPIPANSCDDYTNKVSTPGAQLNGADHPGFCQFASGLQIMIGSHSSLGLGQLPFDLFFSNVIGKQTPPPYQVYYSTKRGHETCAIAKFLNIFVSILVPTSSVDFPAASVGQACLAEWDRHTLATFAATNSNFSRAHDSLKKLVVALNSQMPSGGFRSCAFAVIGGKSPQQQAFTDLALQIKNYMSQIINAQAPASFKEVSGDECKLHCNVCSSGWAGTIKATRTYTGTDYTETDMFFVGGASSIANHILVEWTTNGGPGKWGQFEWKLHADIPGQCDPANTTPGVCIELLTQPGNVLNFHETNNPVPATGAYDWSQNGIPKTPEDAEESQINQGWQPPLVQAVPVPPATTATTAVGQNDNIACSNFPPSFVPKTTAGCTQHWEWNLVKQP
jgi:hypothetical protein